VGKLSHKSVLFPTPHTLKVNVILNIRWRYTETVNYHGSKRQTEEGELRYRSVLNIINHVKWWRIEPRSDPSVHNIMYLTDEAIYRAETARNISIQNWYVDRNSLWAVNNARECRIITLHLMVRGGHTQKRIWGMRIHHELRECGSRHEEHNFGVDGGQSVPNLRFSRRWLWRM
jgi:hypothetical protein